MWANNSHLKIPQMKLSPSASIIKYGIYHETMCWCACQSLSMFNQELATEQFLKPSRTAEIWGRNNTNVSSSYDLQNSTVPVQLLIRFCSLTDKWSGKHCEYVHTSTESSTIQSALCSTILTISLVIVFIYRCINRRHSMVQKFRNIGIWCGK